MGWGLPGRFSEAAAGLGCGRMEGPPLDLREFTDGDYLVRARPRLPVPRGEKSPRFYPDTSSTPLPTVLSERRPEAGNAPARRLFPESSDWNSGAPGSWCSPAFPATSNFAAFPVHWARRSLPSGTEMRTPGQGARINREPVLDPRILRLWGCATLGPQVIAPPLTAEVRTRPPGGDSS